MFLTKTVRLQLGASKYNVGLLLDRAALSSKTGLPKPFALVFLNGSQSRSVTTELQKQVRGKNNFAVSGTKRYLDPTPFTGASEIRFPDYEDEMHPLKQDKNKHARETEDTRRIQVQMHTLFGMIFSLYVTKKVVHGMVAYKSPPRDALALAAVEIDTKSIPEGKSMTFLWNKKPIFVKHRTAEEISREAAVAMSELRDPEADEVRAPHKKEWLVVIGICTHLGCIPIAGKGEFGGYYCPCHGSHYDAAGRVRKGPAPLNLELPPYFFKDDETIVIGEAD